MSTERTFHTFTDEFGNVWRRTAGGPVFVRTDGSTRQGATMSQAIRRANSIRPNDVAMTRTEYDAFVAEHGHAPGAEAKPGEKHRQDRNKSNIRHTHHSRGIG